MLIILVNYWQKACFLQKMNFGVTASEGDRVIICNKESNTKVEYRSILVILKKENSHNIDVFYGNLL